MRTKEKIEIQDVWAEFHKTRDDYHRNLLMEHYRSIIRYSAERLHSKLPTHVEVDEVRALVFADAFVYGQSRLGVTAAQQLVGAIDGGM